MAQRGFLAGLYYGVVYTVDDDGYAMGTLANPNAPVANTLYSGHLITHPISLSGIGVQPTYAEDRGGTKPRGTIALGAESASPGTLTLSDYDVDFTTLATGTVLDNTTYPGFQMHTADHLAKPATLGLLVIQGYHDRVDGAASYGTAKYLNKFYLKSQFTAPDARASQEGGTNPNPLEWGFNVQPGAALPNGALLSVTSLGVTDNTAYYVSMITDYPLHITTWIANGSATTFTLPYLPIYDTEDNSGDNIITKNGAETTVTSVNTGTGVVTIAAAGDSGDVWTVIYKTNYVASA